MDDDPELRPRNGGFMANIPERGPVPEITHPEVTRVEVIDGYGRAVTRYYDYPGVTMVLQDNGRTLKILGGRPLTKRPESVEATPDPNEPNTLELIEELQKQIIMLSGWMRQLQKEIDTLKPRDGVQFR